MMDSTFYTCIASPVGQLFMIAKGEALTGIVFENTRPAPRRELEWVESVRPFRGAIRQLEEYFTGKRRSFDLLLAPEGTPFQKATWRALLEIPYGETRSYSEIACRIGKPKAVRAVGAANGRNPLAIVIPCHRVIGSDGSLTGFGGGLEVKRRLLFLEAGLPLA